MKKKYVSPSSEVLSFSTEGPMAMSIPVKGDTTLDGKEAWSGHRGWNSDDWTGGAEEEE